MNLPCMSETLFPAFSYEAWRQAVELHGRSYKGSYGGEAFTGATAARAALPEQHKKENKRPLFWKRHSSTSLPSIFQILGCQCIFHLGISPEICFEKCTYRKY